MKKHIEKVWKSLKQRAFMLSPHGTREQYIPGALMYSLTRKFQSANFLLIFHYVGMNGWKIESSATWLNSIYRAPPLLGGHLMGLSDDQPCLSNIHNINLGVIQGAHK